MPCGCFGGGGKKKGSPRGGSEAPPKPPKLLEEPIKEQQQIQQTVTPAYSSPPQQTDPETPTQNGQVNHTTANGATPMSTPQKDPDTPSEAPSSTKSTGARSRAELYAKRREFFRPLYDVCLTSNSPNQKFMTPRAASTLPARGKKGGFVIGDETGYFTAEGRFVPADGPSSLGANVEERGEILSSDGASLEDSSLVITDNQFMEVENRIQASADRPPRPTSQPTAPAGQWDDDTPDGERPEDLPQDEFHQKHHQIVQSQHSPSVPVPPPPPKEINPHFVEFQEKHQKIVLENESLAKDPKIAQKIVEKRLTELDKLHNEVKQNYEKRSKHGPIDVDSLVEKYTEERWKKMVEMWESEGLVVEGGMVVVDDQGNVVHRDMKPTNNAPEQQSTQKFSQITESVGPRGKTIIEKVERDGDQITKTIHTQRVVENVEPITESVVEKIENDGHRIVKIVETKKTVSDVGALPEGMSIFKDFKEDGDSELLSEILNAKGIGEAAGTGTVVERIENDGDKTIKVTEITNEIRDDDDDRISVVKRTETITVEKSDGNNSEAPSITTVITPPTPQAGMMIEEPTLCATTNSDILVEEIGDVPDHDFPQPKTIESSQIQTVSSEPLIDLPSDENLNQLQGVIEEEIPSENGNFEVSKQILTESSFKEPPPTCTPPPSPTRDQKPMASAKEESLPIDGGTSVCGPSGPMGGSDSARGAVNTTPPPSPPLEASTE